MKVISSGQTLGATIAGLDLAQPLSDEQFDAVRYAKIIKDAGLKID